MKKRLDLVVVERGLAPSRNRAQAHIMAGEILVNGEVVTKAGIMVDAGASIELVRQRIPYASRGGLKLEAAIDHFGVDIQGKKALDIGSSTGGFTDCLLQKGAVCVFAVDVGYGLMDAALRSDERVILFERTNFRYMERAGIKGCVDIITMDVSFISVTKLIPKAVDFLCNRGEMLVLVKPQFEVGRGLVGKGGIVRDEYLRLETVEGVRRFISGLDFAVSRPFESPVRGQKGNIEYFLYAERRDNG